MAPFVLDRPKNIFIQAEAKKSADAKKGTSMGRFITFIVLLAVCVIALGFYLGWFGVSTTRDETGGRTDVNIRVDEKKIESDAQKAKEKVKNAIDKTTEKVKGN